MSAYTASESTEIAATMPMKEALFAARLTALREYTKAHGEFDTALRFSVDPVYEEKGSDGSITRFIIPRESINELKERYFTYTTAVNMTRSIWSPEVDQAIVNAGAMARRASYCIAIVYSGNEEVAAPFKLILERERQPRCRYAIEENRQFNSDSNFVITAMRAEVNAVWQR